MTDDNTITLTLPLDCVALVDIRPRRRQPRRRFLILGAKPASGVRPTLAAGDVLDERPVRVSVTHGLASVQLLETLTAALRARVK